MHPDHTNLTRKRGVLGWVALAFWLLSTAACVAGSSVGETSSNNGGSGTSASTAGTAGMGGIDNQGGAGASPGSGGSGGAAGSAGTGGTGGSGGAAGSAGTGGTGGTLIYSPAGTSLLVQVLDAAGTPIPSAVVTTQGGTARPTDGQGYILFENLAPGRFSARIERHGFASASAVVDLAPSAHAGTEVRLLGLPPPIPFDATLGAVLDQGPIHVTIPPNAVVDANGEPVTGVVDATVLPLDPTTDLAFAPAPLEADGGAVGLDSLSMTEVTLWKSSQRVQLAPGAKATLELVLPDGAVAQVGESIAAWWLDLDAGIWHEEGAGIVQDSAAEPGKLSWVVEVGHFSWWNCDRPWTDKHCFVVPVTSANGMVPVSGMRVQAEGTSYTGSSPPATTGADGTVCTNIKLDSTAEIRVGPAFFPLVTTMVTGSGPPGDCAGNGAPCTVLAPVALPQDILCTAGQWEDCGYSGPSGSLDVGLCTSARKYCNGAGIAWSNCGGEVLPQAEDCMSPLDEDCDGLTNEGGDGCDCSEGDTAACYTGPGGTQGVGICAAGTRACNTGFFVGPCLGEVTPQPETCATIGVDDDCDGTSDCQGSTYWSHRFGDSWDDQVDSAAIDSAGNVVITGTFKGEGDFGGGPLAASDGLFKLFVAKLDQNGNHIWSKVFGVTAYGPMLSAAIDGADNVVITGTFWGTLDLGLGGAPLASTGTPEIFAVKLDKDGNPIWSKRFGGTGGVVSHVATDSSDNIVLTGSFQGTLEFGGDPLVCSESPNKPFQGPDIFVAKLDPNGDHLWSKRFGDANYYQGAHATVIDSADNVVLMGHFTSWVNFGGASIPANGMDIFVVKLEPNGGHLWSKRFGDGPYYRYGTTMAIDGADNVVIGGTFENTVNFGGGLLLSAGYNDVFVAKLDPNGGHHWSKRFGDEGGTWVGSAAAIDGAGNVVLSGAFTGAINMGGAPFFSSGAEDTYVAKLDPDGNHLWSKRFVDSGRPTSMGIDSTGNVILTGDFSGPANLGAGPFNSAGGVDIYVAKLAP